MFRKKFRWILIEVLSEKPVDQHDLARILRKKSYELFGTFGCPEFYIINYDPLSRRGILKCARSDVNKLLTFFAFTRLIDKNDKIMIVDLYCGGTLSTLLDKIKDIIPSRSISSMLGDYDEQSMRPESNI